MRGKDIPKPVRNWNQCGLSSRVLEVLRKAGYARPMPIQAQALPAIMAGRDCLGIAKTGSGKTLAFVLPMLRHIKDQVRRCRPQFLMQEVGGMQREQLGCEPAAACVCRTFVLWEHSLQYIYALGHGLRALVKGRVVVCSCD